MTNEFELPELDAEFGDDQAGLTEEPGTDESQSTDEMAVNRFLDSFVSFDRVIKLPTVCLLASNITAVEPAFVTVTVRNNSNFGYDVLVIPKVAWLEYPDGPRHLLPGQETNLYLNVLYEKLGPGDLRGALELILKAPFIERAYTLSPAGRGESELPYPSVDVVAQVSKAGYEMTVRVENSGGGLLQGTFYDRSNNLRNKFLLNGKQESAAASGPKSFEFTVSRQFKKLEQAQGGYVVLTNCPAVGFRAIEIDPWSYFTQEPVTDIPFVDFLDVDADADADGGVFRDLVFVDRNFYQKCEVSIPRELQKYLSAKLESRGVVRFSLKPGAGALGSIASYVKFKGVGDKIHEVPVLLSFR